MLLFHSQTEQVVLEPDAPRRVGGWRRQAECERFRTDTASERSKLGKDVADQWHAAEAAKLALHDAMEQVRPLTCACAPAPAPAYVSTCACGCVLPECVGRHVQTFEI